MSARGELASEIMAGHWQPLLDALRGLDRVLERALEIAPMIYGWEPGNTRFRGLSISHSDVEHILSRSPGEPAFGFRSELNLTQLAMPALGALADRCGLDEFETTVVLIALAPEVDVRYGRIYAYLQDDITRKRPSVELVFHLLCDSAATKLDRLRHFSSDGPLLRNGVIELFQDGSDAHTGWRTQGIQVDEQLVREILGMPGIDSRLREHCEYVTPLQGLEALAAEAELIEGLRSSFLERQSYPARLWFGGPKNSPKRATAEAIAGELQCSLLIFNLATALLEADLPKTLQIASRYAERCEAILFLDAQAERVDVRTWSRMASVISNSAADVIVASTEPAPLLMHFMQEVEFSLPKFAVRRRHWESETVAAGLELSGAELDLLARRFRLFPEQIQAAITSGIGKARWRGQDSADASDLAAAARTQSARLMLPMARKIAVVHSWDDIVLPAGTLQQLRAICKRVEHRERVLVDWGFENKLSSGKGVAALFAGPSGVGKTMAAEILARELGIDLYKIDLSGVVSKYIGETEKNLEQIFTAAENANAILFFDEADALFGKRSEVKDSHDRYANIEISYLLQRMEIYEGIAILATNLRQSLDDAFVRRLAFTVHFPFPDEAQRSRIWNAVWPKETPLDPRIDFNFLAARFKLSGGNIKNVAVGAAFLAAEDATCVCMRHLIAAVRREYEKMSKPLTNDQFGEYALEAEA